MSEFWNNSSGENVTKSVEKDYDVGGGNFDPIPEKTNTLMLITAAGWNKDQSFNEYISIEYTVLKPEVYANRKVWQKLWVKDDDPQAKDPAAKRDKALKMLATIDANCGGKLAKAGREPDDGDLAIALTNKQIMTRLMEWEMNGNSGNWVQAVSGKGGNLELTEVAAAPPKRQPDGSRGAPAEFNDDLDDDIPFMTMNSVW